MDVPDLTKLEKAIKDTIEGLKKAEEGNELQWLAKKQLDWLRLTTRTSWNSSMQENRDWSVTTKKMIFLTLKHLENSLKGLKKAEEGNKLPISN